MLSRVGRLPLFGFSYVSFVLLIAYLTGVAWYNQKVELATEWAKRVDPRDGRKRLPNPNAALAGVVGEKLHPITPSWRTVFAFISAMFLAIASTTYLVACPPEVQAFSRPVWLYQHRNPLLHYFAFCWKAKWARYLCGASFAVGGVFAILLFGLKAWDAFWLIWGHARVV
jgi:hypothetical protein